MTLKFNPSLAAFAILVATLFTSCKKDGSNIGMPVKGPNLIVYGLTANNELVKFNSKQPENFLSQHAITGIGAGEKLRSIDFRPATGELYAISDGSKLYVVNTMTSVGRMIGTTAFTPSISGSIASIDFNPTVDRIRLVTNTGQNLRLNPETGGVVATDGVINGGMMPAIAGIAYNNSKAGAGTTTLFDIDQSSGKLYKQDPPNNGTLVEIGSLGFEFTGQAAFDISYDNKSALLAATVGDNGKSASMLALLDLTSGKTARIGKLEGNLIDIAIPTEPVAYAVDNSNNLVIFNPEFPVPIMKSITGLSVGEQILGIDFRPANGQLYALGSSNRIYTINLSSGAAAGVGAGNAAAILPGTDYGFDFNPTVDRIRVVNSLGGNFRYNPIDGLIAVTDGSLNPGIPMVGAAAYSNNFAGATTTSLFVIDAATDKLYLQSPPNNGTLMEIGALGIDINNMNGFDIGSTTGKAYLVANVGAETNIYMVNTLTGKATKSKSFPGAVKAFSIGLGF